MEQKLDCVGRQPACADLAMTINRHASEVGSIAYQGIHCGKRVFTDKTIAAKATKIDLSGFKPLLTSISDAIKAHRAAVIKS